MLPKVIAARRTAFGVTRDVHALPGIHLGPPKGMVGGIEPELEKENRYRVSFWRPTTVIPIHKRPPFALCNQSSVSCPWSLCKPLPKAERLERCRVRLFRVWWYPLRASGRNNKGRVGGFLPLSIRNLEALQPKSGLSERRRHGPIKCQGGTQGCHQTQLPGSVRTRSEKEHSHSPWNKAESSADRRP